MALTLNAFEPFKEAESNSELVSQSLYGVMVAEYGEWIPTHIIEADFSKYNIFNIVNEENQNLEKTILIEKVEELRNTNNYDSWVWVGLAE